jgi:e3 binding domain
MASKPTSQRSSSRRSQSGASRNGKHNGDGLRPAQQARREINEADREYRKYVHEEEKDRVGPPDVVLDVPELRIDSIRLEVDELDAHLALKARVLNLVKLNVGIDIHLSRVKLDVKGVEAEVVLKARLDHVTAIVDRLMTSLDRNPELVKGLSKAVSEVGRGAGEAVDKTGDAAKDIGEGAQSTLTDVGQGAGQAVGDVGQGAGQAVGDVGQGAGQAVGDVGQGAGQAVGNLDQVVGGLGQTVGQAGQAVGQAVGQNGGAQGQPNGASPPTPRPGTVAKEVAKLFAREIGHAASDEARDVSLAAARKVRELGERREQRRADKYKATEAAMRVADELGIDLAALDGTGSDGRITVKDVREAQEA